MSKAKDNRAKTAGFVLPRAVRMPHYSYQRSNTETNAVRGCGQDKDAKAGASKPTEVKIKVLQNLKFG